MGERKVLNKYYSPDFNPDKIKRIRRPKNRPISVTNMLAMTIRCNTCGEYSGIGTKFNMRRELCNEDYLGIKIYRFYFKCRTCYSVITFKTDPKNHDYIVESGGTRHYEAWRDAKQAEDLLQEMKEQEEEENAMKSLENKAYDSKREIENLEILDEIKQMNKRKAQVTHDQLLEQTFKKYEDTGEDQAIKEKFKQAKSKLDEDEEERRHQNNRLLLASNPILPSSEPAQTTTNGPSLLKMPIIKAKKVKTEEPKSEASKDGEKSNNDNTKTQTQNQKPAVSFCSYSDDDE